jgi:DNA primase
LAQRGLAVPVSEDYGGARFGFLAEGVEAAQAAVELAQAVGLLIERPALSAALAEATVRFERDLSKEAYAEQQRLLKRKLEIEARVMQMAGASGEGTAQRAAKRMAE